MAEIRKAVEYFATQLNAQPSRFEQKTDAFGATVIILKNTSIVALLSNNKQDESLLYSSGTVSIILTDQEVELIRSNMGSNGSKNEKQLLSQIKAAFETNTSPEV